MKFKLVLSKFLFHFLFTMCICSTVFPSIFDNLFFPSTHQTSNMLTTLNYTDDIRNFECPIITYRNQKGIWICMLTSLFASMIIKRVYRIISSLQYWRFWRIQFFTFSASSITTFWKPRTGPLNSPMSVRLCKSQTRFIVSFNLLHEVREL